MKNISLARVDWMLSFFLQIKKEEREKLLSMSSFTSDLQVYAELDTIAGTNWNGVLQS